MISKELLSEVLKDNDILHFDFSEGDTILYYANDPIQQFLDTPYHKINIYELAHKCKEWAIDLQGGSAYFIRSGNYVDWFCETGFTNGFDTKKFIADTEPEAIFKACEWILSNK